MNTRSAGTRSLGAFALMPFLHLGTAARADDVPLAPLELARRMEHAACVNDVAARPDGGFVSVDDDGQILFWNADAVLEGRCATRRAPAWRVACSANGAFVAVSHPDGVDVFDPAKHARVATLGDGAHVTALTFHPVSDRLAVGTDEGEVWFVDGDGFEVTKRLRVQEGRGPLTRLHFSTDGARLAVATTDAERHAIVLDANTLEVLLATKVHEGIVNAIALDARGELVATGGDDGCVVLREVRTGDVRWRGEPHERSVTSLVFHSTRPFLASAGLDRRISLWDLETQTARVHYQPGGAFVRALAFDAKGERLLSVGDDACLRVWRVPQAASLPELRRTAEPALYAASLAGERFAVAGKRGAVQVFSFRAEEPHVLEDAIGPLATSRDGRRLVTGGHGNTLLVHDEELRELDEIDPEMTYYRLALAPGGRRIALGGLLDLVVLDLETGERLTETQSREAITCLAWLDDRRVAFGTKGRRVHLHDCEQEGVATTIEGHEAPVRSLAVSATGAWLASADDHGRIRVNRLENATAHLAATFVHEDAVEALAFSQDEKLLAAAGVQDARTIRVFDLATGVAIEELTGHPKGDVMALLPTVEGFASVSRDRTLASWKLR